MRVTVNGEVEELGEASTVADLIERHHLRPVHVAVEINERLVPRPAYSGTPLQPGDRVEIVTLVGGG